MVSLFYTLYTSAPLNDGKSIIMAYGGWASIIIMYIVRPLPNTEGHRECGEGCFAPNRLQWVRNGLKLTTADDYNSKVLSERGGAGQRVGYTKIGPRASPNRITQNHTSD